MDARVRYTQVAIKKAFFELLNKKPLNKVTVTAICEKAEINRATFYKYYTDPFDLMKQVEVELTLELKKLIEQTEQDDLFDILKTVLIEMKKYYEIYMVLCSEHGDSQLVSQIFIRCYQSKLPLLEHRFKHLSDSQKEWLFYFLAQGISGVLERWTANGMKETPEEVAHFVTRLNDILIKEFS